MKRYFAEFIGTFGLVFAGTGAIVINEASSGAVSNVGVALTFGLIVLAMIYTLGDISGAHINPAVTIGFWAAGRFPLAHLPLYIGSQCAGAIAASLMLRLLFPSNVFLGGTAPAGSQAQSFILETHPDSGIDVRNSRCFDWRPRKRHHCWHCCRIRNCAGSDVCRTHLRSIDESSSLACASYRIR